MKEVLIRAATMLMVIVITASAWVSAHAGGLLFTVGLKAQPFGEINDVEAIRGYSTSLTGTIPVWGHRLGNNGLPAGLTIGVESKQYKIGTFNTTPVEINQDHKLVLGINTKYYDAGVKFGPNNFWGLYGGLSAKLTPKWRMRLGLNSSDKRWGSPIRGNHYSRFWLTGGVFYNPTNKVRVGMEYAHGSLESAHTVRTDVPHGAFDGLTISVDYTF